ncbi:MAG: Gfo/Idh/MocA family oxidoreductase [Candidatus Dependentiae bacterium]|jgi:predicted dehydrogenase
MVKKVKVGIIGMGRMGTFHATQAATLENVTVTALVDTNPGRISDDLAPAAVRTSDYTQLLDLVDAVVVATPTPAHYQIAHDFLSHGIHVLVEKPITQTLTQARKLFQLAERNHCALHVGHVERHNFAFLTAQELLDDGPQLLRAVRSGPFSQRVAHDSVVLDLMIHDIDLLLTLAQSEINDTQALGTHIHGDRVDSTSATMRFANGTLATVAAHRNASCGTRQLMVDTPTQQLEIDFGKQTVVQRVDGQTHTHSPRTGHNPLREQLKTFVTAITTHTKLHDATHDLAVLQHTLAIEKKAETHPHLVSPTHEVADSA